MAQKVEYRLILRLALILIAVMIGSFGGAYAFLLGWSTYGAIFFVYIVIAILGLIGAASLYELLRKRRARRGAAQAQSPSIPEN
jgi:phosphate/sulfate permease